MHYGYVAGALQAMTAFAGRIRLEVQSGSWLPRNRDVLTTRFLDSSASHLLFIDSDIGWKPEHAQMLLDSGKDFVSGCYPKKQADRAIPAETFDEREGDLWRAKTVPAGFLLLSRPCIERMVGAYRKLEYDTTVTRTHALWSQITEGGCSFGEDISFCLRWRAIGGDIWLHKGVKLTHYGEFAYEFPTAE